MSLCVCLVHQVIVHEVPGQELDVEVYDKDPDQDDFLGRYILHTSSVCLHAFSLISHFHLSLSSLWGKSQSYGALSSLNLYGRTVTQTIVYV